MMFDTFGRPMNFQGMPPWEDEEDFPPAGFPSKETPSDEDLEDLSPEERLQKFFEMEGVPEEEQPIGFRASEAEKLYANLLLKTDFEREFIEEVLEFQPNEEEEMRIEELKRKRREMKEMAQQLSPPAQGPTTILI